MNKENLITMTVNQKTNGYVFKFKFLGDDK